MRFSPAASIAAAFVYSFMIAFLTETHFADAVFALFVLAFAYKHLRLVLFRMLKLNIFIVFVSLTVYLFHHDTHEALLIFYRANMITLVNVAIFSGFTAEDFYYGFHSLRLPDRFTVTLFFMVKYTEILGNEYNRMKDALKVRNFVPKTNLFTYKTYAYLAGMLLVRSMDRAVKLSQSMKLRGFSGRLYPFNYVSFRPVDGLVVSMLIIQGFLTFGGMF